MYSLNCNYPNLGQALIWVASSQTVSTVALRRIVQFTLLIDYTPCHALYSNDKSATVYRFVQSDLY